MDQQVKVRGFPIELGEVAAVLEQHPLVSRAFVDAPLVHGSERSERLDPERLDPDRGSLDRVLVAYVVAPAGTQAATLRALCQQRLPEHMVPAHFVVLDRFPMTTHGKVDRRALPTPSTVASRPIAAPSSALQTAGAEVIDLAERFVTRPRALDVIEPDPAAAPVVSLEQSRLAFIQGMHPDSATYNVSVGLRLRGALRVDLLTRALASVVARHEPLRTGFVLSPDGYRANIVAETQPELAQLDLSDREADVQPRALDEAMRAVSGVAFDLRKPPLVRALLVKLGQDEHVLVIVVHGAVFDGPSKHILLRELTASYDALVAGTEPDLPLLPIRFNDVVRFQLARLERSDHARELAYWKTRLVGPLPVLQLPHDRPRPRVFSHLGSVYGLQLSREQSAALRDAALAQHCSLSTLLLAAFHTLLHRYSGQSDLLVAVPVAAREHPQTRDLIGLLINTLVVRSEFAPGMTFEDLLTQVRTRLNEALDHRELPFERLVAELNPPRDPSVTPVFQALFSYDESDDSVRHGKHFEVSSVVVDQTFAGTDLSLFVEDSGEHGLSGHFEYSTDLFDRSTVANIADGFRALLEHLAEAPQTPVERLRAMSNDERQRQLTAWNDTLADFDLGRTVVDLFESTAARDPARRAVIGREHTLSYGELDHAARALSHLLSEAGAGHDVGVAVFLERSPRLVTSLLAVLRAGSYYIPLDPGHPAERNQRIIATAKPKLVLAESRTLANLPELGSSTLVNLDELLARHSDGDDNVQHVSSRARAGDAAYVIFTSGSTGDPKGVSVPHRALSNFLLSMAIAPGLSSDDVLLSLTTISFDIAGLELYLPLITGATVEVGDRELALDPKALAARLRERGVTMFQATPATFRMLVEDGWSGQPRLKVLCGGEAFPPDLAEALFSRVGSVWNMYGPTETTIWSSLQELKPGEVISIGHPIHNTQLYVLNDALEPVPHGAAGMLWIGGDGVATGYFRRPDLTDAVFLQDPFSSEPGARIYKTGDLARRLQDGRLECLGRTDFQVKIRGYRIELGEIETAIRSYPGILQTVVHVKTTPSREKQLVGFVVQQDHSLEVPSGLVEHLRAKLPHYMVPGAFVAMAALPLTPNGKVDRKALPDPVASIKPAAMTGAPPRDDIEVKIADIFRSYLSLDAIDSEANFFDLGGHSLLAARVTRELNATFELELSVGAIFEKPTVQGLAEIVRNRGGTLGAAVIPLHNGVGNVPLFFICGVHLYQTLARNLGAKQASYGVWVPAEETFLQHAATGGQEFEEFAAEYVKTIRKHTPHGPYNLAGVSFGGLLAFEVARQLRAAGESVPALVLLDAILPEALSRNPRAWLQEKVDRVRRLGLRRAIDDQLGRMFNRVVGAEGAGIDDRKKRDAELWRAINGPSCTRYLRNKPGYNGPTMIVRALFRPELTGFDVAPELGWADKLRSTVSVVDVPGDHLGILTLSETAEVMRSYLESLQPRDRRSLIPSLVSPASRPPEPSLGQLPLRPVQ
jgi:amino acid adenylation domain-containing protein